MTVFNITLDCAVAPASTPSDAGVAGAGILLAFIITAALALLLSGYIILSELRSSTSSHAISRKLLSGLSDQQIVEGISIQAIGLVRINSMVPYHFFIIWMLSLLSTATNFAALLALVKDYKRDWVLRWLRQAAMFVNLSLTVVFGVFVLEVNMKNLSDTLPIGCVWDADHAKTEENAGSNHALSVAGTIAVISASAIVFVLGTWYLHLRKQLWGRFVRVLSLALLFAIAVAAAVRVVLISQAFGTPSVRLADQGETEWSFGQLLAMVLLVLPFVSALEIYRGELQVPICESQVEPDQMPLTGVNDGGKKRYTYQSNPWFK
ncbi:hypothetical protein H2198_009752 [Neophaeococcomyces mojaviensis]|uniref:Uncharacterized protein n=1 Tax=Neophaeococcomyces mojaviensis TaxID=3383035 RepID=A0ACC2ZTT9_9EURO|nr:hypothetical protein H2198_009752 [Knufia sp. JES_112]